ASINTGDTVHFGNAGAVAHHAAGRGEVPKLVDRGHRVAERQRGELITAAVEEGIIGNYERVCSELEQSSEGCIDVAFGGCVQDTDSQTQRAGRRLLNCR